jgi:hypothetical protein
MITGLDDIAAIFAVFHDGSIISADFDAPALRLVVEITYLAERVNPEYESFSVRLDGISRVALTTWPCAPDLPPTLIEGAAAVFSADLQILDGSRDEEAIKVVCSQHDRSLPFSGGELYIRAATATVTDPSGKEYSVAELFHLSSSYWDDWAAKGRTP